MSNHITTVDQLKRAIVIAEQIESLQAELNQILSSTLFTPATSPTTTTAPRKGQRSPAVRAKMAAAQKARWAKSTAAKAPTAATIEKIAKIEAKAPKKAATPKAPKPEKAGPGKSIPLSELKTLLEAAPEKTLNIRKAGLQLRNIKVLATANPSLLRLGGKTPWPTVTMLK